MAKLQAAATVVFRDAKQSRGIDLVATEWLEEGHPEIGAAIHERGIAPRNPSWEAVGLLHGGDAISVHPPRPYEQPGFPPQTHAELVFDIAGAAQDLVQVILWQRHEDPTWPACVRHAGRPLELQPPAAGEDSGPWWVCCSGAHNIPAGELRD